jgi:glucan 1,3-beta-glucosidase
MRQVVEPFITPQLFEPYANEAEPVHDEYHLSIRLGSNLSAVMEEHYSTFIVGRSLRHPGSSR